MKIDRSDGNLNIEFDNPKIKKLKYDREGTLTVITQNNEEISHFSTVAEVVFNSQYGTPISEDGEYVFIGTWERGLFCYLLTNGQLIWKKSPGKVCRIIPYHNQLIIEMPNRGIFVRDAETGEFIKEIKMSGLEVFRQISDKEIFVGPKFNKYFIISLDTVEPIKEIQTKDLNSNNSLSFVIRNVFYKNKDLYIEGFEQYQHKSYHKDEAVTTFERKINA